MSFTHLGVPASFDACKKPALLAAHPGHELKVFGWIAAYKPRIYVITDGSGHGGVSRLPSTMQLLAPLGIEVDEIFGLISDRELYQAILDMRISWFLGILDRIADSFIANRVDLVLGDALEGFNPAHDICRMLADAAATIVNRKAGRTISNYRYCLTEWDRNRREHHDEVCSHFILDDDGLRRKIEAAERYVELKDEVRNALAIRGVEYFRVECLKKVGTPFLQWDYSGKPDYEVWGEKRVEAGKYQSVIRYHQHIAPIADAIRGHATGTRVPGMVAEEEAGDQVGSVKRQMFRSSV